MSETAGSGDAMRETWQADPDNAYCWFAGTKRFHVVAHDAGIDYDREVRDAIIANADAAQKLAAVTADVQAALDALEQAATGLAHAVMFCAGAYSGRGMTLKQTEADPIFKRFVAAKNVSEDTIADLRTKYPNNPVQEEGA